MVVILLNHEGVAFRGNILVTKPLTANQETTWVPAIHTIMLPFASSFGNANSQCHVELL